MQHFPYLQQVSPQGFVPAGQSWTFLLIRLKKELLAETKTLLTRTAKITMKIKFFMFNRGLFNDYKWSRSLVLNIKSKQSPITFLLLKLPYNYSEWFRYFKSAPLSFHYHNMKKASSWRLFWLENLIFKVFFELTRDIPAVRYLKRSY